MKTKAFSLVMLSVLLTGIQLHSCTIFYVVKDNKIYAGNNEDWEDPYTKIWFYPSENSKHGWVKFGFGSGFPQGGMNDQGLFWDATAGPYLAMPLSEANKEIYPYALMQKVMEECSNIEEVMEIFANFYCADQYKAQYLVGDSLGNSIIIEGDNIISMQGNYQVLTNFYQSHPDLGGYPCWRYETATDMLSSFNELTPYFMGSILDATHQEGKYPTQYSNIYDLKNGHIYLFYYHNYEEFINIDLITELNKGHSSFDIPNLFSKVKLLSPLNGENITSTSVTFCWQGISGNSYEVIYSTDNKFTKNNSTHITHMHAGFTNHAKFIYFLPGLLLIILWNKRKSIIYSSMLIMFVFSNYQCKKEEPPPPEANIIELTKTINNLLPNTTYYWKVKAHTNNQNNFYSETLTRSFNIGSTVLQDKIGITYFKTKNPN